MVKKTSRTELFSKLGERGQKSFDKHKGDETTFSSAGDLPTGIEGGIAELVECKIGTYEKGDSKGELFFYAAGIVRSPTEHNSQRIEGLRTSIMEPLHATPTRSRKTLDDHLDWMLNQLRMLGLDTSDVDFDNLEDILEALKSQKLYFRFRTWQGEPTDAYPNPRVNHQWNGQIEFTPDESTGVVDETETDTNQTPRTFEELGSEVSLEELAIAADNGDEDAQKTLEERALGLGVIQERIDGTGSWDDVMSLIENVEKSEKGAEDAFPTYEELGIKADGDDDEAIGALTEAAKARQLNPDEYATWSELAVELETAPPVSDSSGDLSPEKGEVWFYKPPRARKRVECEVTAVFEGKETCNLKNIDDGKSYKSVRWGDLSQEE